MSYAITIGILCASWLLWLAIAGLRSTSSRPPATKAPEPPAKPPRLDQYIAALELAMKHKEGKTDE